MQRLAARESFPATLVQGCDYCAHPSWFTRGLLQLKKLALLFLILLRVFLNKFNTPLPPMHLLRLLSLKAVKQTYPKVFSITILQDGFFHSLKPSRDAAH